MAAAFACSSPARCTSDYYHSSPLLSSPATQGMTRSSRRSGMARRIAHTICRCWAMQRLRISTGSTSAEHPPAGRAAGRGAKGRVRHQQGIPGLLNRSPLLRWCSETPTQKHCKHCNHRKRCKRCKHCRHWNYTHPTPLLPCGGAWSLPGCPPRQTAAPPGQPPPWHPACRQPARHARRRMSQPR